MESLVHAILSNALVATVLAVIVAGLGRAYRRPALIHSLWLVVLVKLVTPPVVPVSMPVPRFASAEAPTLPAGPEAAEPHDESDATPAEATPDLEWDAGTSRFSDPPREDGTRDLIQAATERWEPIILTLILAGALGWWSLAAVRIVR